MTFLQCSLDDLYRSTRAFLQGSFDIPSRGAWKNRGMCRCFFNWLLVKKLISQKTLLCVVICVNENWVALLFQDSLALCSVKCKGWPFGTILVWRSRSWVRARAPCEGVVSTLFGRARADLERSNHTTKSLRIIFSKHK